MACAVTGPAPLPERLSEVVWRAGLDLNPLQANSGDDRRWLASLIWPEQIDRAQRLDRALDLVAADPPRIDTGPNAWTERWIWSPPTPLESTPVTYSSTCLGC